MQKLHVDDALDFIAQHLATLPGPESPQRPTHNDRPYGSDLWVPYVAERYWQSRGVQLRDLGRDSEPFYTPFYDAAWQLSRFGVVRPGQVVPQGQSIAPGFNGDGFSLTSFGREWVRDAAKRPTSGPSRFAELLLAFGPKFGSGFEQRAAEAVRCYRTGAHLAACVMAGAAAESVMLALAIMKSGDEDVVLRDYRSASGSKKITDLVVKGLPGGLAEQVRHGSGAIAAFWRNEAAHGTYSHISEIEAHASLSQLLRFCQVAVDNWGTLTKPA